MFAGMRAIQAPVLHGILIGLTSLLAWVIVNAIAWGISASAAEGRHTFVVSRWDTLSANATIALLFIQIAMAIIGALIGYNIALRGKPGLSEHEPLP
jgi:hypothetical protein